MELLIDPANTCTCTELDHPELDGEFGPDVTVSVLKVDPGCPVHSTSA